MEVLDILMTLAALVLPFVRAWVIVNRLEDNRRGKRPRKSGK